MVLVVDELLNRVFSKGTSTKAGIFFLSTARHSTFLALDLDVRLEQGFIYIELLGLYMEKRKKSLERPYEVIEKPESQIPTFPSQFYYCLPL